MLISNMPYCECPYIDMGIVSGIGYTTGGAVLGNLQNTLFRIRNDAIAQMEEYANNIGADAIYNCQFCLGTREMNNVIMVTGTSVKYRV